MDFLTVESIRFPRDGMLYVFGADSKAKPIPAGMAELTVSQLEHKPMNGKMKTRDYAAAVALSLMLLHSASAAADPADMRSPILTPLS